MQNTAGKREIVPEATFSQLKLVIIPKFILWNKFLGTVSHNTDF